MQAHAAHPTIGHRVRDIAADFVIQPFVDATVGLATAVRFLFHSDLQIRCWGRDKAMRHPLLLPCGRFNEDLVCVFHSLCDRAFPRQRPPKRWSMRSPRHRHECPLRRCLIARHYENCLCRSIPGQRRANLSCEVVDRDLDSDASAGAARSWDDHSDDELCSLIAVLGNAKVEAVLRHSAASHLSRILQGSSRQHPLAIGQGLPSIVLGIIAGASMSSVPESTGSPMLDLESEPNLGPGHSGAIIPQPVPKQMQGYLGACFDILEFLLTKTPSMRKDAVTDPNCTMLVAVLRCLMAVPNFGHRERSSAAAVVATLVFASPGTMLDQDRGAGGTHDTTETAPGYSIGTTVAMMDKIMLPIGIATLLRPIGDPHAKDDQSHSDNAELMAARHAAWCIERFGSTDAMVALNRDAPVVAGPTERTAPLDNDVSQLRSMLGTLLQSRPTVFDELGVLNTTSQIKRALEGMRAATTHPAVAEQLMALEALCFLDHDELRKFCELNWRPAFER